jgi:hypothetical protein
MWKRLLSTILLAVLDWMPVAIPVLLYKLFEDRLLRWVDGRVRSGSGTVWKPLSRSLHAVSQSLLFSVWTLAGLLLVAVVLTTYSKLRSREHGIVLEASGGSRSDMYLSVRNLGPTATFLAQCKLLSARDSQSITRVGLFRLKWADFESAEINIPAGASRKLMLARSQILRDVNDSIGQMDVLEWTREGEQSFLGTRWWVNQSRALPKFDVQVSLYRMDEDVPHIRMFTIRPRGPEGPLEIVPLADRRKTLRRKS